MKCFLDKYDELTSLTERIRRNDLELEDIVGGKFAVEKYESLDQRDTELYTEYYNLVHEYFDETLINHVVSEIGHGTFTTKEFNEALLDVYRKQFGIIDIYKDFTLRYEKDCWGDNSYFVHDRDGHQYSEGLDYISDESAIKGFRYALDHGMLDSIGLD